MTHSCCMNNVVNRWRLLSLAVLQTVAANFTVEEFSVETEDRPTEPEGRTRRTEPSASSSSVDVWCIKNMQSVVRWVSHIIGVSSGLSREHRRSRSGQKQTEVVFECFVKNVTWPRHGEKRKQLSQTEAVAMMNAQLEWSVQLINQLPCEFTMTGCKVLSSHVELVMLQDFKRWRTAVSQDGTQLSMISIWICHAFFLVEVNINMSQPESSVNVLTEFSQIMLLLHWSV